MADNRFFSPPTPITVAEIVTLTGAEIAPGTDSQRSFSNVAPLDKAAASDISFLDNVKYVHDFTQSKAGACFVRPKFVPQAPVSMVLLVTDEPYYAYALTARKLYPEAGVVATISPLAVISEAASIGKNVRIDSGAVIESGAVVGEGSWIGANSVIGSFVQLGDHCRIGANCTLSHCIVGNRVVTHRGVHIGQDGFGFAPGKKTVAKVPQLGRVIIGDHVEIGAGTCIDASTMSTRCRTAGAARRSSSTGASRAGTSRPHRSPTAWWRRTRRSTGIPPTSETVASVSGLRTMSTGRCRVTASGGRRCRSGDVRLAT